MIKTIIFDWDGVIVDSMGWISEAMQEVLLSYGVKKSSEEVRNEFFQPGSEFYNSHGVEIKDKDELKRRHKAAIAKHKIFDPLFPEVKEVLHFLKDNNFKLGIVSSTDNSELVRQLELLDIKGIFSNDFILGKASNKNEKLRDLIKIHNLSLDETLYVGDISTDIISAKEVGIKSAGIERREEARKKLGALNPDYLFSSLIDLKILLEKQLL